MILLWESLELNFASTYYYYYYCFILVKNMVRCWAGHVKRMGIRGDAHRVLVGRPEGKRPLGRPGHRREDNIKMGLQDVA
jgi:hypothetical protein